MPTVDSFERKARKVRRALRRLPLLEPLVNRLGLRLWRRHLDRIARSQGLNPPSEVVLDPRRVRRRLPVEALPRPVRRAAPEVPVERGGRWDRAAVPLGAFAAETAGDDGPVVVAFDRRGRACLVSGRRALERARTAGERVAASVALRHSRWARLVRRTMAYAEQRGGSAYQPYLHPDLAGIPADQGHERFELLLAALPVRSGTLVDLGANSGYFSHRFEAAGFSCVAVERSQKEAWFLAALRDAEEREFTVLKGSLTEVGLPARPDVVLALNIFHHFLKSEETFAELRRFLARLRTRYLLFEPHLPDDPQMRSAARNMAPEEFAGFVAATAGLPQVERLGTAADARPLFLLAAAGEPVSR